MQLFTIFKNYFTNPTCNMTNKESYIRLVLAVLLLIISFINGWTILFIMSIISFYTAVSKDCFVHRIFDFNKSIRLETLYLKNLPKYNPDPVFILDNQAKTLFKNEPAKEKIGLDNFKTILGKNDPKEIIKQDEVLSIQYECEDNKTYLINFRGVKNINFILAYATDISSAIEAEQEIINTQKDVVYTMGAIGETRSKETGNHVRRVALYSEILALKYGLSKEDVELLKLASPMHDIGKVGIKDEILNKPGKLTDDEFKIMKTHSTLGFNMLKNSDKPILKAAAIVANEHHEKWDGSGYPKKLAGEDIHIFGRITAVADVFDALGSERVYKKAWGLDEIFELFKDQRGKHFDPKLIDLFFEHFEEFNEVRLKYQDK